MTIRNFLQKENIREEIVTIPWYREGPGNQKPILMRFICMLKPFSQGTKFIVHGVDFYRTEGRDAHLYYSGDPMNIPRLSVSTNRKKLRYALAAALSGVTGARIEHVSNTVMWYTAPGIMNIYDDECEENDDGIDKAPGWGDTQGLSL